VASVVRVQVPLWAPYKKLCRNAGLFLFLEGARANVRLLQVIEPRSGHHTKSSAEMQGFFFFWRGHELTWDSYRLSSPALGTIQKALQKCRAFSFFGGARANVRLLQVIEPRSGHHTKSSAEMQGFFFFWRAHELTCDSYRLSSPTLGTTQKAL
jgi:hypothetical protein